jgi:S1-C subfamily serine protease
MKRGKLAALAGTAVLLLLGCSPIDDREPASPGPRTGQLYCQDPDNGIIYSPSSNQCDPGDVATTAGAFEGYLQNAGKQSVSSNTQPATPAPTPAPSKPIPAPEAPPESAPQSSPKDQVATPNDKLQLVSYGSAFFISPDGYLLTNDHVVAKCDQMLVVTEDGEYPARVVAANEPLDLALLKVNKKGMPYAAFAATLPEAGDTVYAVGYPIADELGGIKITDGIVSGLSGEAGDETRLQLSIPVHPGNSGGPLLDETGLVVGVIAAKLTGQILDSEFYYEGISFAIIPEAAGAFLLYHHVTPAIRHSDVERKARDIMRDANRYTWPALCLMRPPA